MHTTHYALVGNSLITHCKIDYLHTFISRYSTALTHVPIYFHFRTWRFIRLSSITVSITLISDVSVLCIHG